MTLRKRLLATFGAMALVASSLVSVGTAAAQSEASQTTSITVLNTACVDETPTSITMLNEHRQMPNRDPQSPAQSIRTGTYLGLDIYVNECLGQGWTVTASVTDFHSGGNVIPSATHLRLKANSYTPYVVGPNGYSIVSGTTPLPWSSWTGFTSSGSDVSTLNVNVSSGTAESVGQMYQYVDPSLQGLPNTIPGGDYEATLTMTFTSDGP